LIGSSIEAATGVVYNITGGKDITLQEVNKVSQVRVGLATLVLTLESLNGIYTDEFRKVNIMGFNIKTVSRSTNTRYLGV
jgi:cell division GTPase FtsZ